jgi:hypothetical protein
LLRRTRRGRKRRRRIGLGFRGKVRNWVFYLWNKAERCMTSRKGEKRNLAAKHTMQ